MAAYLYQGKKFKWQKKKNAQTQTGSQNGFKSVLRDQVFKIV